MTDTRTELLKNIPYKEGICLDDLLGLVNRSRRCITNNLRLLVEEGEIIKLKGWDDLRKVYYRRISPEKSLYKEIMPDISDLINPIDLRGK